MPGRKVRGRERDELGRIREARRPDTRISGDDGVVRWDALAGDDDGDDDGEPAA
jgi:hypothetical protein